MQGNENEPGEPPRKSITYSQVLSLSREIHPGIPTWPGDPRVEFQSTSSLRTHGYFSRKFSMGEHSGTHINAPNSFHANGLSIDQYSSDSLVVEAVVVDVTEHVKDDPDYALTMADLDKWEKENGHIGSGSLVLLRTGWDNKWTRPEEYRGTGADDSLHFPGFGVEAVQHLLNNRNVGGLGIDSPGIEPGIDLEFTINRLTLEQPRIVLENLCNLEKLPASGTTLVIGTLSLAGGTGSPASVLAFLP